MKTSFLTVLMLMFATAALAQSPVGKWKRVSYLADIEGKKVDMHAALLKQRPCAAKIVYEFAENGKASLDAAACEEGYRKMQEKLWSKTKWKVEGSRLTTSSTDFALGTSYTVTYSGRQMTWKSDDGVIVYERL
ncbi:lipocalin-like domain-containing protein [Horticoccus sp. 23ND18S-11]|uniref:lipocalin family protein n=1 Tax=Horticoccus sp. 23ND18S-11 TaxID=3391832 RepID=UPI0039C9B8D8